MERPSRRRFGLDVFVMIAALTLSAVLLAPLPSLANPSAEKRPVRYPPADLIRLDNPSRSAILRHEIRASLDPETHTLTASDRIVLLHPAGVPATEAVPFLLWDRLSIDSVKGEGADLRSETAEGMNPRSFWKRPPYDALEDYARAREVSIFLTKGTAWPETLRFTVSYSGEVMDSLRPPQAAYARSFDTTAGLITAQGAYLAGSTFWVPTRPGEVFTFNLRADLPSGWRAVSQGELLSPASNESISPRRVDFWGLPPSHG